MDTKLNKEDLAILESKGISKSDVINQLELFAKGFPYLDIVASVSNDQGLFNITHDKIMFYIDQWDKALLNGAKVVKFVPASGAASRMFKELFNFINASYETPMTEGEKEFFDNITRFAFYKSLEKACIQNENKRVLQLISENRYKDIVKNLLYDEGLGYGTIPKGLIEFHAYDDGTVKSPLQEQLAEGLLYAKSDNEVNIHFTVSSAYLEEFKRFVKHEVKKLEEENNVKFKIEFSVQKSSTDTIAVDSNNEPFRVDDRILFRPAGHGALIENLNEIDADYIFIKNIDNVVPDKLKIEETQYKKLLGGVLCDIQTKMFEYARILDEGSYTHEQLIDALQFLQRTLKVKNTEVKYLEDAELALYLIKKINRPIRVCGIVKNIGEPGGGPFLVKDSEKVIAPQILESSQIDLSKLENRELLQDSQFFNPVDLVCGVKNFKRQKYDLTKFVDPKTGFISEKSMGGKKLKALELPGLWNGAMADWNTVFVEVPVSTFNPVKVVNDLLRPQHQGK